MVTDRLSSAGMFVVLAMLYEEQYMFWFTLLAIDIGAHWLQMASTYAAGMETHKTTGKEEHIIIRIYYTN